MLVNKKKIYIYCFIATLFILANKNGIFSAGPSFNYILEILGFSALLLVKKDIKKTNFILISIIFLYIVGSYIYAVTIYQALISDFLIIYKSFIYMLILLAISTAKIRLNSDLFISIFRFILISYLVVYTYQLIFKDINRPYLLAENNFEIMFVSLLFILRSFLNKPPSILETIVFISIGILSGSRSGLVLVGVSLIASNYKNISSKNIGLYILVLSIFIISLYEILIYGLINSSLEDIDRYLFFLSFVNVYLESEFFYILFGQPRITALPFDVCQEFSSYSNLFSHLNNGTCYSVIWHSFITRALYDHGLVGFFLLIFSLFNLLSNIGYSRGLIFIVILVILLNGLSVSSMNSVFFLISMVFYIMLSKNQKTLNVHRAD